MIVRCLLMDISAYFQKCRDSAYCKETNRFLLSRISSSAQEKDLTNSPNCKGFGRIRHFKRYIAEDWGKDPLPIDPAVKALNLSLTDTIEAQVFQIASCNVHCWYCFVPDALKCCDSNMSCWFSANDMVELYINDNNNLRVIDLSGGNPELVPEWVVFTMKELQKHKLDETIYLWSDDTLTTDYTFRYLSSDDLSYMKSYKNYGKVCCFKGFDHDSFTFNTGLPSKYYELQFDNFSKYLELKLDLYGYVTFTTNNINDLEGKVTTFISKLRSIHPLLPLRIVPLKIILFSVVKSRLKSEFNIAIQNQVKVHTEWSNQLKRIYEPELLSSCICDISLS